MHNQPGQRNTSNNPGDGRGTNRNVPERQGQGGSPEQSFKRPPTREDRRRPQGQPSTPRQSARPPRQEPDRPRREQRERAPRTKNRWFRATLMVAVTVVGCIFLAFFILRSTSDFFGLNQPDNEYLIEIPEGSDIKAVTEILAENGIVETPFTFRTYYAFKEKEPVINSGEYTFNSNMAYNEIIGMLKALPIEQTIVRLTIQEDQTLEEIALLLEENKVIDDAQDFLTYLNTAEYDYEFLKEIPNDSLRYHKYEGYFFPDTYEFYQPELYDSIALKFFNRFEEMISDDMYAQMKFRGLTLDETITLASVVQKEAGIMRDMVLVSSVFHNRLNNANFPNLQSDVTLLYAEDFIKPHMTTPNQEMYDAYNTYVKEGLPIGPICNPGAEAIEAALGPITTDYYYFVTDINAKYYYAATLDQHNQNIAIAKEETDETGKSGVVHGVRTRDPDTN